MRQKRRRELSSAASIRQQRCITTARCDVQCKRSLTAVARVTRRCARKATGGSVQLPWFHRTLRLVEQSHRPSALVVIGRLREPPKSISPVSLPHRTLCTQFLTAFNNFYHTLAISTWSFWCVLLLRLYCLCKKNCQTLAHFPMRYRPSSQPALCWSVSSTVAAAFSIAYCSPSIYVRWPPPRPDPLLPNTLFPCIRFVPIYC